MRLLFWVNRDTEGADRLLEKWPTPPNSLGAVLALSGVPSAGSSDPPSRPGRNNEASPSGPLIRGYCRTNRSDRMSAGRKRAGNKTGAKETVVTAKPRSVRQAQALHAAQLREEGRTWAEIGVIFQSAYRVNPRVAMRQAHGWSQPQAAERWTEIWPDDPKTFKNFSYWEQWPGQTGHAPSLDTLDKLARLYECRITDLLGDCRDYGNRPRSVLSVTERRLGQHREHEQHRTHGFPADRIPGMPADRSHLPADDHPADRAPAVSTAALQAALETIKRAQITQLIEAGSVAEEPARRLRRRTLLLEASSALAIVAAAPVLEVPRLVGGSRGGALSTDLAIVDYTSDVVAGLRRLGGTVGPRITL